MKNFNTLLFRCIVNSLILLIPIFTFSACADFDKPFIVMVGIPGGTFTMGSPLDEPFHENNETQHPVYISSFYMSKYPVTQEQWVEVMGSNPSFFQGMTLPPGLANGCRLPVEQVTWYDAVDFCNKLSEREGLEKVYTIIDMSYNGANITSATVTADWSKKGYRLPTEAEWEYACRAGTKAAYNTGAAFNDNTGWYDGNSVGTTHVIAQKQRNAWGLYDMHGNVCEWCWDYYGSYSTAAQTNPKGPDSGSARVFRGGSWFTSEQYLRSAYRESRSPGSWSSDLGFRVVRP